MGHVPNTARLARAPASPKRGDREGGAAPGNREGEPYMARALRAAAASDPGRQREVNEDRLYCDAERGVFAVIDGVGGQAAGGKAADVAQSILKEYLGRDLGSAANRLRDGIT